MDHFELIAADVAEELFLEALGSEGEWTEIEL